MTDKEYAAIVKQLLTMPDEPEPAPQKNRAPSESKTDEELGLGTEPVKVQPTMRGQIADVVRERPIGTTDQLRADPASAAAARAREERNNPIVHDPIAQGIIGGTLGAGAGALATPVAEAIGSVLPEAAQIPVVGAVAPRAAAVRALEGAANGSVAAKTTGGNPGVGALMGAGLGALAGQGEAADARALEREAETEGAEIAKRFGRVGNQASKEKIEAIGDKPIRRVLEKYNVPGEPAAARAALKAARQSAGEAKGAAIQAMDNVTGDIPMKGVVQALDDLQARWAKTRTTKPYAEDVANLRTNMLKAYGDKGMIKPSELDAEIGAIEGSAYAGSYNNPTATKAIQRATAAKLNDVLDAHLETAAKTPGGAEALARLRELNQDYRVLKTLSPIAQKAVVAAKFAETPTEAFEAHPVKAVKEMVGKAATLPIKATKAVVQAGNRAIRAMRPAPAEGIYAANAAAGLAPNVAAAAPVFDAVRNKDPERAKAELAKIVVGQ